MPFPIDLESLLAAGYVFLRSETCPVCGEMVEVFSTPGNREIVFDPMAQLVRAAVRHYEKCDIRTSAQEPPSEPAAPNPSPEPRRQQEQPLAPHVAMFGVNDPNHQLLAVGYEPVAGILRCRWKKGEGEHRGVPENIFESLKRAPWAYSYYTKAVKGKYPYTKVE